METKTKLTLKAARVNAGLTQKELAELMNVNVSSIGNWETGKASIKVLDFKKICKILKVDESQIFFEN